MQPAFYQRAPSVVKSFFHVTFRHFLIEQMMLSSTRRRGRTESADLESSISLAFIFFVVVKHMSRYSLDRFKTISAYPHVRLVELANSSAQGMAFGNWESGACRMSRLFCFCFWFSILRVVSVTNRCLSLSRQSSEVL